MLSAAVVGSERGERPARREVVSGVNSYPVTQAVKTGCWGDWGKLRWWVRRGKRAVQTKFRPQFIASGQSALFPPCPAPSTFAHVQPVALSDRARETIPPASSLSKVRGDQHHLCRSKDRTPRMPARLGGLGPTDCRPTVKTARLEGKQTNQAIS